MQHLKWNYLFFWAHTDIMHVWVLVSWNAVRCLCDSAEVKLQECCCFIMQTSHMLLHC